MRTCPSCKRLYPEVAGAPTQVCPHCGHEDATAAEASTPAPLPGVGATPTRADPAAAAAHAFRFFGRHWAQLLLIWLPALALDVAVAIALRQYTSAAGIPLEDPMTTGQAMRFLGVAMPLYLAAFTLKLATWVAVGALVLDKTLGGTRLASLGPRLPAALALGFVLTLAYLAGVLLFIVPFFFFLHWFLFAPAAFADGKPLTRAIEASRAFSRERRTMGFTALTILVMLGIAIGGLGLASMLTNAVLAAGATEGIWTDAIGPIAGWIFAPLIAVLPASYYALAQREPTARPPAPDATAAERFRTTKCPQCSTLIPYTATGEPVDVSCPVCGHAGRIL